MMIYEERSCLDQHPDKIIHCADIFSYCGSHVFEGIGREKSIETLIELMGCDKIFSSTQEIESPFCFIEGIIFFLPLKVGSLGNLYFGTCRRKWVKSGKSSYRGIIESGIRSVACFLADVHGSFFVISRISEVLSIADEPFIFYNITIPRHHLCDFLYNLLNGCLRSSIITDDCNPEQIPKCIHIGVFWRFPELMKDTFESLCSPLDLVLFSSYCYPSLIDSMNMADSFHIQMDTTFFEELSDMFGFCIFFRIFLLFFNLSNISPGMKCLDEAHDIHSPGAVFGVFWSTDIKVQFPHELLQRSDILVFTIEILSFSKNERNISRQFSEELWKIGINILISTAINIINHSSTDKSLDATVHIIFWDIREKMTATIK